MTEESKVTTTRRELAAQGDLAWGGDGQPWRDAINTNSDVTVTDQGGLEPASRTAIPDSGNLHAHYDLQQESYSDQDTVTTLTDQSGNGRTATAVGTPTYDADGFNGHPTAALNGSGDGWEISDSDWGTLTQPWTSYAVIALDTSSLYANYHIWELKTDDILHSWYSDGNWRIYADSEVDGSSEETVNLTTGVYDGTNSILEERKTQTEAHDVGSGDMAGGMNIGSRDQTEFWWDGRICELVWYDGRHDATTRSDVQEYLIDRWSL